MECLDDRAVNAWVRGTLATDPDLVRNHLDSCDSCRDLVTSIVDTQWIGRQVGRYQITELIGGGAMGEVFRARDPDLGRDVAIKLMRAGGSERRLLREAQAMARLTHPHVLRVYDVGTAADDKVFLAMELVQGVTLAEWFRGGHGWRAVVAIMRQAGRGLFAAHEAQLVHGDFKPENVLVAADGRVLVTDFGLARSDDRAAPAVDASPPPLTHTATRGFAGTPAYMAPEQLADGEGATPATDQFSFCVALYEGLFGQRPWQGKDLAELRDAVTAGKLDVPATPRLPGRLVRALRRGLSTRAADRFASLGDLLAELDGAVSRRGRTIALAVAGMGLAAAGSAWAMSGSERVCVDGSAQLASVWNDRTRAKVKSSFEATKLPYAATSLATVTNALDRYASAWADAHNETCAATNVRKEQSPALLDARMQCLQRRRQQLSAFVDVLAAADAAAVRDSVNAVNALSPIADCAAVTSLAELEKLPGDPAKRKQIDAATADLAKCRALLATDRYRPAHECAQAAAKTAAVTGYGPAVAEAELVLGMTASRLRNFDDADAALERALLAAETSRDSRSRAQALIWLVATAGERSQFAQGHKRVEHAGAVIKGLGDDKVLASDLAFRDGLLALREGKLDASVEGLTRALTMREELYGPTDARVAEPLSALATVQTTRKQYDDAQKLLDRAVSIHKTAQGDNHPAIAKTLHILAQLQLRMGKHDDALASQKRSYDLLVAAYGEEHRDVALSVGVAAHAYFTSGRYADAEPFAKRSAELMEKVAPDSPDSAVALQTYAAVLSRANKHAESLAIHERALAIRLKTLGPDHIHTTQSQVSVAMALRMHKRCTDALPLLQAALDARAKQLPADHPDILRVLVTQGDCQIDLGNAAAAVAPLERALAGFAKTPRRTADDRVMFASTQYALGRALWDTGKKDRAKELVRAAHKEFVDLEDKRYESQETWAKERKVTL